MSTVVHWAATQTWWAQSLRQCDFAALLAVQGSRPALPRRWQLVASMGAVGKGHGPVAAGRRPQQGCVREFKAYPQLEKAHGLLHARWSVLLLQHAPARLPAAATATGRPQPALWQRYGDAACSGCAAATAPYHCSSHFRMRRSPRLASGILRMARVPNAVRCLCAHPRKCARVLWHVQDGNATNASLQYPICISSTLQTGLTAAVCCCNPQCAAAQTRAMAPSAAMARLSR